MFGGSFNPPHYGHLFAAVFALKHFNLDEVWFVPTFKHAFDKASVDFSHRQAMLTLLTQRLGEAFKVSAIEKDIQSQGASLLTLLELKKLYPNYQFRWIIGSDLVDQTNSWYKVEQLKSEFGFLIVPRGEQTESFAIPNVSSSDLRQKLRDGKKASGLTSKPILDYITRNKLTFK